MRRCLNAFLVAILSLSLSVDAARGCWRTRHVRRACPPAACVTTIVVQPAAVPWCETVVCPPGCGVVVETAASCCGEVIDSAVVGVVEQPTTAAVAPSEPAVSDSASRPTSPAGPAAVGPEVPTLRPALPDEGVQAASNDVPVAEPARSELGDAASVLADEAAPPPATPEEPEMKDEPSAAVPAEPLPAEPLPSEPAPVEPPADGAEVERMRDEDTAAPAVEEPAAAADEPEMKEDEAPAEDAPAPPVDAEEPAIPVPGDEPAPATEPAVPPPVEPAEEPNPFDDDSDAALSAPAEPAMTEEPADSLPDAPAASESPLPPSEPAANPVADPAASDPLAELLAEPATEDSKPATEDTEEMTEESAGAAAPDEAPEGGGAAEPAVEPVETSDPFAPVEPPPAEPVPADDFVATTEPSRRWIHASGGYAIVATLVDVAADGACVLETRGRRIRVPLENLSDHDRDYVRQAGVRLAKRKADQAGETAAAAAPAPTDTAGL